MYEYLYKVTLCHVSYVIYIKLLRGHLWSIPDRSQSQQSNISHNLEKKAPLGFPYYEKYMDIRHHIDLAIYHIGDNSSNYLISCDIQVSKKT